MTEDFLGDRRRALEESFFREKNAQLLADFREHLNRMERKEQLADASGIHDEDVLHRLLDLNLGPETLAALTLVPLVEVAWADGKMSGDERAALLQAVAESGVRKEDDAFALLQDWLEEPPAPEMLDVWKDCVAALRKQMDSEAFESLKHDLLDRAHTIAIATGGMMGLGNRITKAEQQMLDGLTAAFG